MSGRLQGGPAGLQRAWQIFNGDGSGSVGSSEFGSALKVSLGIIFAPPLQAKLIALYENAPGSGQIDFGSFAEKLMGSSRTESTSIANSAGKREQINDDAGNSDQMLRRKVRVGLYPIVTLQYISATLYQVSYHIQYLFFESDNRTLP